MVEAIDRKGRVHYIILKYYEVVNKFSDFTVIVFANGERAVVFDDADTAESKRREAVKYLKTL